MKNMNVLITGTSSGFGQALVEALLRSGSTVIATMRNIDGVNREKAVRLKDRLKSLPGKLYLIELDVCDDNSVKNAVQSALLVAGSIEVVINNAGVADHATSSRLMKTR